MANPNPAPHARWAKGFCPNPGGKPALPESLKKVKEFTTDEIKRVIAKYMRLPKGEMLRIINEESDELPMFEAMICSILSNAYNSGDFSKLDFLLNRSGHRQKDEKLLEVHQHNHEVDSKKNEIVKRMDEAEILRLLTPTGS